MARRPVDDDEISLIDELVAKYGAFFGLAPLELPDIELRDNLGSKWLARTEWSPKRPDTSTIQIQESVLGDPRTLERIIAHEMIHHVNFVRMTAAERAMLKYHKGSLSDDHGRKFHEMADMVNAQMGDDFVTERSDSDFEVKPNEKPFYILIEPAHMGRVLGWSWAVKLSGHTKEEIERRTKDMDDVALVETTDARWTRGVKIKRFGGCSVPRAGSEDAAALQELYEAVMNK
jgi:hypothetical protein